MTHLPEAPQRRKDKRFKQWTKTTIVPRQDALGRREAAEAKAFTYDLSLCGAQVHTPEAFAIGTAVRLRILLTRTKESVKLDGRVKWVKRDRRERGYQMGIEFFHENPQGFMVLMKELFEGRPPAASAKSVRGTVSGGGSR